MGLVFAHSPPGRVVEGKRWMLPLLATATWQISSLQFSSSGESIEQL
jgi:hypothetical protein